MTMLQEQLWRDIPSLQSIVLQNPLVADSEKLWLWLRQLLLAQAPSTGTMLPGAIIEQFSDIAAAFGLADRLVSGSSQSNAIGLWLGVAKAQPDLIVTAHLDRLTFRVKELHDDKTATVAVVHASQRFGEYVPTPARAFRYDPQLGHLSTVATGQLAPVDGELCFEAEQAGLSLLDLITLDIGPRRQGDWVRGSGLDNCAGVLSVLGAASVLRHVEELLLEHNRRCLFLFPDHRGQMSRIGGDADWHGYPSLGTVLVDGQPVESDSSGIHETGFAYAFSAAMSADLLVPMNYQCLAHDLAAGFENGLSPVAQYNPSADVCSLSVHEPVLGIAGPLLDRTHIGHEIGNLKDIQDGVWWLSAFVSLALNLVPSISSRYVLGR